VKHHGGGKDNQFIGRGMGFSGENEWAKEIRHQWRRQRAIRSVE
jgi:hypothetical protein